MSLSQLEYFVAVAEEGQLTRAAQRLGLSQPPLTRQIHLLEEELGTPLLARHHHGVSLLPQGEIFLSHARALLLAVREAKDAVQASTLKPQASTIKHQPLRKNKILRQ